jgi:PKD repeat protein
MMRAAPACLLCLCLLLAGAGCTAGSSTSTIAADEHGSFSLRVLEDSFVGDGSVQKASLRKTLSADYAEIDVWVEGASGLKALYFELDYDSRRFNPLDAEASGLLDPGRQPLELAVMNEAGLVQHGQVLANWPERSGFNGDAVLARIRFARQPFRASDADRNTSLAPDTDLAAARFELDVSTKTARWYYQSPGDYDQNGETNISDLTPLGANFGTAGPFDYKDSISCVDGDENGAINISDITPIGAHFGRRVDRYWMLLVGEDYFPQTNDEFVPLYFGVSEHLLSTGVLLPGKRRVFLVNMPSIHPLPGAYYWVRPMDGESAGTPSNVIYGDGNGVPALKVSAQPSSGGLPLEVQFTAEAVDNGGVITNYQWDFNGDNVYDQAGADINQLTHTYTEDGTFIARVRVTDNGNARAVRTVKIVAGSGLNLPPQAALEFSADTVPLFMPVELIMDGTADPDGAIVWYEYDLDGDGIFDTKGFEPIPNIVFTTTGTQVLTLRVTDNGGAQATASDVILVTPQ